MKRITGQIAAGLGGALLLTAGTAAFFIATDPGLQLLAEAGRRTVPGFEVKKVEGSLLDLRAEGLSYRTDALEVSGDLRFAWRPTALFDGVLEVNALELSHLRAKLGEASSAPAAEANETQSSAPEVPAENVAAAEPALPIRVVLQRAALQDVDVTTPAGRIKLAGFETDLQGEGTALRTGEILVDGLRLEPAPAAPEPKVSRGETLKTTFAAPLIAGLPEVELPLSVDVERLTLRNLSVGGPSPVFVERFETGVQAQGSKVVLSQMVLAMPEARLTGAAEIGLDKEKNVRADGVAAAGPATVDFSLEGSLLGRLRLSTELSGPARLSADFSAEPAVAGLPFDAAIRLSEHRAGTARVADLSLRAEGCATDWRLDGAAKLEAEGVDAFDVKLSAQGGETVLREGKLGLAGAILAAEADLHADWSDAVSWDVALKVPRLDTKGLAPEFPLSASGGLNASGLISETGWSVKLHEMSFLGKLRGEAVSLRGDCEAQNGGRLTTKGLTLDVGRNHAALTGSVDLSQEVPHLNMHARLRAPDFSLFSPELAGSAEGHADIAGPVTMPSADIDIRVKQAALPGVELESARLAGRVTAHDAVAGELKLTLEDLKAEGADIHRAVVDFQGGEASHKLTVSAEGEPVSVRAALDGRFDREHARWSGRLSRLETDTPVGPVTLERPVSILFAGAEQEVSVSPFMLKPPHARAGFTAPLRHDLAGRCPTDVAFALERFDLGFFKAYLPGRFSGSGALSANLNLRLPAGLKGLPTGNFRLRAKGLETKYAFELNDLVVGFDEISANAKFDGASASADWSVGFEKKRPDRGQPQGARSDACEAHGRVAALLGA